MKKLLTLFAAVALFGAGCFPSAPAPSPEPATPSSPPAATSQGSDTMAKTPEPAMTGTSTTALSPVDDTWKTYTSKAGDFSFQWPTKGRFAPTWESSFSDTGCAADAPTLDVNGISFCHESTSDGAAGTIHYSDTYKTAYGKKFIVLGFTKAGSTVTGFDEAVYKATLDQIVGTFRMLK